MTDKGFSLIELVVVVGLAGVLIMMSSAPSFLMSGKSTFESANVELRDALQQARNFARTKQQCVVVQINPTSLVVTGYTTYSLTPPCNSGLANPDPNSSFTSTFSNGVTLTNFIGQTAGNPVINPMAFNPQGGTDYGYNLAMTTNLGTLSTTFTVLPLLGQIEQSQ